MTTLPLHSLRRKAGRLAPYCAGLLLAGCAGLHTPQQQGQGDAPVETPRADHAASPRVYQDSIDIAGRLSVRYQRNGAEESLHGGFNWTQRPGRILLTLLSPLGQTVAVIEDDGAQATLRQPGQPLRTAADVDALTTQALGWPLPVAGLRFWLQGFAASADGSRFVATPDTDTDKQTTTRDGWSLRYAGWNREQATPHPRRIDLQRDTEQAGKVEIRIVVDNWQTGLP